MNTEQTETSPVVYIPETAGHLMTEAVPRILQSETIREIETLLLKHAREFTSINYIYIITHNGILIGVSSIKDVFRHSKDKPVAEAMTRDVIAVRSHTSQKRVLATALRYNLKAVPVVDKAGRFLGVVTSDTILQTLHLEHNRDLLATGGIGRLSSPSSIIHGHIRSLVLVRLPWLLFGLVGGLAAAYVVGTFEHLLETQIILALFIPAIVYMSDAVGTQSQMIFIRSMALDHDFSVKKYFLREMKVGVLIAFVLALLLGGSVWFWKHDLALSFVVGISLAASILASIGTGLIIPILLNKFKRDTALGSGPFATVVSDITSIVIYFSIASLVISLFGVGI